MTTVEGATETVMFCDLATWLVSLINDKSSIHTGPFPGYSKKSVASSSVVVAEKEE